MISKTVFVAAVGVVAFLIGSASSQPFERVPEIPEAAFPTPGLAVIRNYTRVAPYIALAGRPGDGGIDAAAAAGFKTVIDLRQPDEEGVAQDVAAASQNGLVHFAMPMPSDASDAEAFMERLKPLLDNSKNYPILLHCGSANRVAAAWAIYRAQGGTEPQTALEEARAAGLTGREPFVREVLGLLEVEDPFPDGMKSKP